MATLADADLAASLQNLQAHSGGFLAMGADQGHIGHVDRRFALDDANLSAHIACAPLVFLHQVDARDYDTIAVVIQANAARALLPTTAAQDLTPWNDAVHGSAHALVIPTYYFNGITFSNLHHSFPSLSTKD
jgi:hypothetical protein